SGRANVVAKFAEIAGYGSGGEYDDSGFTGIEAIVGESSDSEARQVVARIKELEDRGYAFEGAEASFHLLARRVKGEHQRYFDLHGFTITIDKSDDGSGGNGDDKSQPRSEATVRVAVAGKLELTAASGDGPVSALDNALLKALTSFYPTLTEVELIDYKVRVLAGPEKGTSSVVRVQVQMSDGQASWNTVGASTNIIEASYEALVDAYEYKLIVDGVT